MKKLKTRTEIENEFLYLVDKYSCPFLCWLFDKSSLEKEWKNLWLNQENASIDGYFLYESNEEDLTYLTRCLTLHMMLDDNEHLLE